MVTASAREEAPRAREDPGGYGSVIASDSMQMLSQAARLFGVGT